MFQPLKMEEGCRERVADNSFQEHRHGSKKASLKTFLKILKGTQEEI